MSDVESNAEASGTKPCRVCGEGIKLTARKCIHCDSWQDWRGSLGLSATILSLLVALVSVSTIAAPVWTKFVMEGERDPGFEFLGADAAEISILMTNHTPQAISFRFANLVLGQAAMAIGMSTQAGTVSGIDFGPAQPVLRAKRGIFLVPAGTGTVIHLTMGRKLSKSFLDNLFHGPSKRPRPCSIIMGYKTPDGFDTQTGANVSCGDIYPFLYGHVRKQD